MVEIEVKCMVKVSDSADSEQVMERNSLQLLKMGTETIWDLYLIHKRANPGPYRPNEPFDSLHNDRYRKWVRAKWDIQSAYEIASAKESIQESTRRGINCRNTEL